jgi:hypothetical protein
MGEPEHSKRAAKFLYYLKHDPAADSEFKSILRQDETLNSLKKLGEYSLAALLNPEVESTESIDQIQVFAGFPLSLHIPAGESARYIVEIPEPNCILTWGFATKALDLSYYSSGRVSA